MIISKATIITARSSSQRYPNKILKDIVKKKKSIDILIKRSKKIGLPIILATTNNQEDDGLCNYVKKKYKIMIFRGNKKDKIKRWYDCFKKYRINKACMIDGDDICFDYDIYKKNISRPGFIGCEKSIITGIFTNIIDFESLKKIYNSSRKFKDTEMIEPFVKKSKIKVQLIKIDKFFKKKKIRLTFDYEEDLLLFRKLFSKFRITEKTSNFLKYLIKNKKIASINFFREKNWRENQLKKIKIALRNNN